MAWSWLSRFVFLSAMNCQVTVIVVESWLFRDCRAWIQRHSEWLGRLVTCDLCFGTWVGFFLAIVFRPTFVDAPPLRTPWPEFNELFRRIAVVAGDAFTIALGGRALNEILGLLDREVAVREEEKELLAEEVEQMAETAR